MVWKYWHLLNNNQDNIAEQISNNTEWADKDKTSKIMASLAPLVMAYINKQQQAGEVDASSISTKVAESSSIWDKDGFAMKMATKMLDENNDWSITDDLLKKWMDMFFWDKK